MKEGRIPAVSRTGNRPYRQPLSSKRRCSWSCTETKAITTGGLIVAAALLVLIPLLYDPSNVVVSAIEVIDTTSEWSSDGDITIDCPISAADIDDSNPDGDNILLFLFLSRTDNYLPLLIDGWTRAAECFKSNNSQSECWTAGDCQSDFSNGKYCSSFTSGTGKDLATVVFYKQIKTVDDLDEKYEFDIRGGHASWAVLTAVRGADPSEPVRDVRGRSRDGTSDSEFPGVYAEAGDLLLLSMAFDDTASKSDFGAPDDTDMIGYTAGTDEAGFLYAKQIMNTGITGEFKTSGSGGSRDKDALISMSIRAASSSVTVGDDTDSNSDSDALDDNEQERVKKLLTTVAAEGLVIDSKTVRANEDDKEDGTTTEDDDPQDEDQDDADTGDADTNPDL